MEINESKSVVMIFGTSPTRLPPFTICGVPIEVVKKQVYIGFRLSSENVAFSLQGHYKVKAEKPDAISHLIWGFEQKGGFHPKVAIFFASHLVQRFTCYAWKNFVSDRMQADVGVGQGSALSPVLCALVVAPIMKLYRIKEVGLGTTLITFVDDGTIAAQTDSIEMNCCMLYHAHAFIHALFTAASLVFEHDKYEAFHFTRPAPRLTFVEHIRYYSTKALTTVMAMRMLGNSTRGLLPKNKHILYRACVVLIAMYGHRLWFYEGAKNVGALKTLSSMQRKAAIWITGAFRTSPTGGSELLAGLPPIRLHLPEYTETEMRHNTALSRDSGILGGGAADPSEERAVRPFRQYLHQLHPASRHPKQVAHPCTLWRPPPGTNPGSLDTHLLCSLMPKGMRKGSKPHYSVACWLTPLKREKVRDAISQTVKVLPKVTESFQPCAEEASPGTQLMDLYTGQVDFNVFNKRWEDALGTHHTELNTIWNSVRVRHNALLIGTDTSVPKDKHFQVVAAY
ncbi:hypothetical protein NMY22_g14791 [Coprinellus aureogranulatus]|nr:hypothetical protein NMY22_g14791 [Coprinellus aureogranulatus]